MPDGRFEKYQASLQEGHDHLRSARLKEALASYRKAAELGEARALPHGLAAGVLIRLGRLKDALGEYDKALKIDPADVSATAGKAGALRALGKVADAAKLEARLAELEEQAEAERLASLVAGAGGKESTEGLLVTAERMLGQGRRDVAITAWLAAARRYGADGQLDAALDTCLQALMADSGSPTVHLELARLYFLRGWHQRGAEHLVLLSTLLELAPDEPVRTGVAELAARYADVDSRLGNLVIA